MRTIDFSNHDIGIFIKGTWQKYAGAIPGMHIGRLFKITSQLQLRVIITPLYIFSHFDYVIKYMLPLFN
jgi:hypothetical protein